ncbi:MAG: hypothetical protein KGH63_04430 [Candidatus Micrarchaeota archaeon]|nr:hypothetical protein [Candidatus Micrarchaeota archaeon]
MTPPSRYLSSPAPSFPNCKRQPLPLPLADPPSESSLLAQSKSIFYSQVLGRPVHPLLTDDFKRARERFIFSFLAQFPSLDALQSGQPHLGISQVKQASAEGRAPWFGHLRTMAKCFLASSLSENSKPGLKHCSEGSWYRHQLPLALEQTGWFETNAGILDFVEQTRAAAKADGDKLRRVSVATDLGKVFGSFRQEAVCAERMAEHAADWTESALRRRAKAHNSQVRQEQGEADASRPPSRRLRGHAGHWFSAARAAYRKETGIWDRYLGEDGMLAWLVRSSGLLDGRPNPEGDMKRLLDAVSKVPAAAPNSRAARPPPAPSNPAALPSHNADRGAPPPSEAAPPTERLPWPESIANDAKIQLRWEDLERLWDHMEEKRRHLLTLREFIDSACVDYPGLKRRLSIYFSFHGDDIAKAKKRYDDALLEQKALQNERILFGGGMR